MSRCFKSEATVGAKNLAMLIDLSKSKSLISVRSLAISDQASRMMVVSRNSHQRASQCSEKSNASHPQHPAVHFVWQCWKRSKSFGFSFVSNWTMERYWDLRRKSDEARGMDHRNIQSCPSERRKKSLAPLMEKFWEFLPFVSHSS